MSETLLQVENLSLRLNNGKDEPKPILDRVGFILAPGKTLALLGESGCGKSMTALSLTQLLPAEAEIQQHSAIRYHDQDLLLYSEKKLRQVRGHEIAMIFQEPMTALNPVLTVSQQISEVLRQKKQLKKSACREQTLRLLQQVGIADPEKRLHQYPHQLSGGLKQRVMIAIALAGEPKILIADEPTTALDVTIQAEVLALLKSLQQSLNMSILLITHDLGVVATMADTVAVMYAGQIVEQAASHLFFAAPYHPYSQLLQRALPTLAKRHAELEIIPGSVPRLNAAISGCRFAERCPKVMTVCRENPPEMQTLLNGRRVACHLYTENAEQAVVLEQRPSQVYPKDSIETQPVLEINSLNYAYSSPQKWFKKNNEQKVLDNISLTLHSGQTLALVGESGCGKTTLGKTIIRLLTPQSGDIILQGTNIARLSQRKLHRYRQQIQMIFQDPYSSLNPRQIIRDSLTEGLRAQKKMRPKQDLSAFLITLLQQVGLPADSLDRYPHEFSGGQRQRIVIARALAMQPKILICDEPTSALDVSVQAQIIQLLKSLQRTHGLAYLFISHNLGVVAYLADYVAVMQAGKIVEFGPTEIILTKPTHPYTATLLKAIPRDHL